MSDYRTQIQATVKLPGAKEVNSQIRALEKKLDALKIDGTLDDASLKRLNNQLSILKATLSSANAAKSDKSIFQSLAEGIEKLTSGRYASVVSKVMTATRQAVSTIGTLDALMADLGKTSKLSANELLDFYYSANDTAKQMGVSTKEIIAQAAAWSRLGFNTADAAVTIAKYASMLAAISPGMNLDTAANGLISVMKAFNIGLDDTDDVVDGILSKINIIGNTKVVNNTDIVDFLIRSASAMAEANNTLEDTIALGAAITGITKDAAQAGDTLNTVSMRVRGYDEETKAYVGDIGELSRKIADLTKTASTPNGISLFSDAAGTEFKSTRQLLQEISEIYGALTEQQQTELLTTLTGKGNGQAINAVLNDYDTVTASLELMADSAGSAEAQMAVAMDSIDYKLNKVKETGTGIAQNLFGREDIKTVLDVLGSLGNALDWITEKIGLFGTVGIGIGGFLGRDKSKQRFCPVWM